MGFSSSPGWKINDVNGGGRTPQGKVTQITPPQQLCPLLGDYITQEPLLTPHFPTRRRSSLWTTFPRSLCSHHAPRKVTRVNGARRTMAAAVTAAWAQRLAGVRGLLLDISGVLYDGGDGGGTPIPGSIEAVARIKQSGLKLRFCTNESQKSRDKFVGLLRRLGFDISVDEITSPAPAARQILKERGLRPYLLVHDDVRSEFEGMDTSDPNCVVIGDAGDGFSYQSMNEAFRVLIDLENPVLLSLGKGRYYKETDGLMLDVGPYMRALETLMIGDDIVSDVGGARHCGMRALQVRTGKFSSTMIMLPKKNQIQKGENEKEKKKRANNRKSEILCCDPHRSDRPGDEHHPEVQADGYVNDLAEAVDLVLRFADK
ncbi:phospholysine phosphohistidine inorganic pyrophosphate phosphatase isoform X2 [Antechinus flavipes]|uniref:phospholysine phosphohistidine inorganic pyrophosphate phosphatase isoform X2 n=1 Tax=Antechinus flavipes TaxID=38775 RepID=UPI0022361C4B|nr:phospholysine phosphohistidine inorganic pyrophosphate phosphatase isoform X2 [Antechinus flavipes]